MYPAAPAVLALLLLLPGLAAALPECTEAILRVALSPEPREPLEVCLSAGQDTVFRSDTRLPPNGVVVEPAGRPQVKKLSAGGCIHRRWREFPVRKGHHATHIYEPGSSHGALAPGADRGTGPFPVTVSEG
jgi:hypothetical protein